MPLRPLAEADLDTVRTWRNAPEVRKGMFSTHEITQAEHLAWFARINQDPHVRWCMHEDMQGQADGVVGFTQYRPEMRTAFWGFYLDPGAQTGAGSRLGLDGLDHAFSVLNLHKLNAEVIATNERSLRFHQRLGFRQEGLFRDAHFDGNQFVDVLRFSMLESEWAVAHAALEQRVTSRESAAQATEK